MFVGRLQCSKAVLKNLAGYAIFFKHYKMLNLLILLGVADLWSKLTVYVVYVRLPITQLGIYLLGKVTEIHRVHVTEKYKTREL